MANFVRQSKYRHVYADQPKPEQCFTGLRLSSATGEQSYIKVNSKFLAFAGQGGGGPFYCLDVTNPIRADQGGAKAPKPFAGHAGNTLDFDFNPFLDNMIASCADDATVKVWWVPDGGNTEAPISEARVTLTGHQRKVMLIKFNPTILHCLGSVSSDHTAKLWNVETGQIVNDINHNSNDQLINDIKFSYDGALMGTTCKDKCVRVWDCRAQNTVAYAAQEAHASTKTQKMEFLGDTGLFATTGSSRTSNRQVRIWDPRALDRPLREVALDNAAGVLLPFYDNDTRLLFVAGKGDGAVRYFEIAKPDNAPEDAPYDCFGLDQYRNNVSQKGMAMFPKTACDVTKNEIVRLMKLTPNSAEPLSFVVPRKSDLFQDDIFPETRGMVAQATCDVFNDPSTPIPQPPLISLRPGAEGGVGSQPQAQMPKTAFELQQELDSANKRIAELEARIAELEAR